MKRGGRGLGREGDIIEGMEMERRKIIEGADGKLVGCLIDKFQM